MKPPLTRLTRLVVGLELFLSLGALYGGGTLLIAPDGSLLGVPLESLEGTPFATFLVPGAILFLAIGVFPLVTAVGALLRKAWSRPAHLGVGVVLVGFEVVEMALLGLHPLQVIYLIYGLILVALSRALLGQPPTEEA